MTYDLDLLSYRNAKNAELADQLFGAQGYCILRSFASKAEVEVLRSRYGGSGIKMEVGSREGKSFHHFLAHYIYKDDPSSHDQDVLKLAYRAFDVRNQVALQPNSDRFMQDYCQRKNLNPEDLKSLAESQFSHSFLRIARYRDGEGQNPHYDNPGELQAILFLSERGPDYKQGGLVLLNEDNSVALDVDASMTSGDLIILNSYKKKHMVNPIVCEPDQIGRMHLFIPIIPDYLFSQKPYFFSSSKAKLFFPNKISALGKIKAYAGHFARLALGKTRSIDEAVKY